MKIVLRYPSVMIGLLLSFFLVCVGIWNDQADASTAQSPKLKVGFIYVGPISDWGWNYAQEQGRLFVQKTMNDKVDTTYVESIYESAEAERVIERMIAQGCKLIFATSYGYLEPILRASARHPDVTFMQLSRFEKRKNLGSYFYLQYQPMYLAGVVAGRMTKTNKLGYIGSNPVPPIIQSMNAYALGVHSVNPKAKLTVVWTNKWVDPVIEVEAAKGLIETGVDILAFDQSGSSPIVKTAESKGIKVIGSYVDAHQLAPKQWLTGACLNWGPFYTEVCQSVIDHNWKGGLHICDLKNGYVDLAAFGPSVPNTVQQEVKDLKNKIKTEKLIIFAGPLKDVQGTVKLPSGEKPSIEWLSKMNFFVSGIDGNLPKN